MEQAELLTGAGVLADLDEWEEELSDVFETSGYETALRYYREKFRRGGGRLVLPSYLSRKTGCGKGLLDADGAVECL